MTKEESVKILGIEKVVEGVKDDIDPKVIMDKFEDLFERNGPEKGGSFYLQSKIYFAKEFLMQDYPPELNVSRFNPTEEDDKGAEEAKQEEETKEDDEKKDEQKK